MNFLNSSNNKSKLHFFLIFITLQAITQYSTLSIFMKLLITLGYSQISE